MNFSFQDSTVFASSEDAALYFNSMVLPNHFHYAHSRQPLPLFYPPDFTHDYYSIYEDATLTDKQEACLATGFEMQDQQLSEDGVGRDRRGEMMGEELREMKPVKTEGEVQGGAGERLGGLSVVGRGENVKIDPASYLITNVYSYIVSQLKSRKIVQSLLKTAVKTKIFYTFMGSFKKLNGKRPTRRNLKNICEITPHQLHYKVLIKSVQKLLQLPLPELRTVLRRLIFNYLRADVSLLPLLTSKQLGRTDLLQLLQKRRELQTFMVEEVGSGLGQLGG